MFTLLKTTTRILSALALCAMVAACGQAPMQGNFPVAGGQNAGSYVAPTIMDY